LNPKVLKIEVMHNDWKNATKLKEKQILAISAAKAQDKISYIDSGLLPSIQRQPPPTPCPNPPLTPYAIRIPDRVTPMDLNNISSNTAFTFPKFRSLCVQQGICQRCGQTFDEAHKKVRGCVLPDNKHIDIKQKLKLFCQWQSTPSNRSQLVSQVNTTYTALTLMQPSQNPQVNASVPPSTGTASLANRILPTNQVLLDHIPPP
jgi:hypothetical protein